MSKVMSKDGTQIAFDRSGDGPPVVLVDGALSDRRASLNVALAAELVPRFTVYTYDRRGRGDSGDTAPYAIEHEVEDIEALVDHAGGKAALYGISSGGVLALDAANRLGPKITTLAVYEAPFVVDDTRAPVPDGYLAHLKQLVASGRRGQAVDLFMAKGIGLPGWMIFMMWFLPSRSDQKALAHTLPHDAAIMGDTQSGNPLPKDRWAAITVPALVIVGGKSPVWMRNGQRALADLLPIAQHRTLEGQMHIVKAAALAPLLDEFFAAGHTTSRRARDSS
jgi:pimeloyl-ACP methyl ester carboxylesterase